MSRIQDLYNEAMRGTTSATQLDELMLLLAQTEDDEKSLHLIRKAIEEGYKSGQPMAAERLSYIRQTIFALSGTQIQQVPAEKNTRPIVYLLKKWGWAAASLILCLGIGAYFWNSTQNAHLPLVTAANAQPILPGMEGAILTLADGSKVVIDSLSNGVIAMQNGSQVTIKNGELVYDVTGEIFEETAHNIMTTPNGRQFTLLLPDGTKVWLNAASSIRYPTIFTGNERKIEVTGEAYFEVATNNKMPFVVNVNNKIDVKVLGTHFNVNAYENEPKINTTLFKGAVRVSQTQDLSSKTASSTEPLPTPIILKPGQTAQLSQTDQKTQPEITVINDVDTEKVLAWKNGLINFDGASFQEIMRQVERWYDIKVVYKNSGVLNKRLAGGMTRDVSLNGLLEQMENMDIRYKIDNRTLILLP